MQVFINHDYLAEVSAGKLPVIFFCILSKSLTTLFMLLKFILIQTNLPSQLLH